MSETTELRSVRLIGPRLALAEDGPLDSGHFAWRADLALAYVGGVSDRPKRKDYALVNYTHGLRVLLQAPHSDATATRIHVDIPHDEKGDAVKATVKLRTPHLLVGNVHARRSTLGFPDRPKDYVLRAPVPESDPEKGKNTRGFSTLVLPPLDPWP